MFFAPAVRTARFVPRSYDRSFERFVSGAIAAGTQRTVDVEQDEKTWTLTLDVPGLAREDLSIGIEGTVVRIESKPEAKLENGVLTLKLGKLAPVSNVHQLTIN